MKLIVALKDTQFILVSDTECQQHFVDRETPVLVSSVLKFGLEKLDLFLQFELSVRLRDFLADCLVD